MKKIHTYKHLTWIDVTNPTHEEVLELMSRYHLPRHIAEELLVPTPRPKIDVFGDNLYLVLHFPITSNVGTNKNNDEQEIDFIINKEFLITVHYTHIDTLLEFEKTVHVTALMDRDTLGNSGGFLFYHMVNMLYQNIESSLNAINTNIKVIENNIFAGNEDTMVRDLSETNRRLLDYRRSLRFQGMTLTDLTVHARRVLGEDFGFFIERLAGRYREIMNMLESDKQLLDDLRSTNEMLLTTRTNRGMKMISIFAFFMIPLTAAISFLEIYEEVLDYPLVFAFIMLGGLFIVLIFFLIFRRNKWM